MKEANYLNMTTILTAVKTALKKAADWLASHKWHIVCALLLVLLLCGVWVRHSSTLLVLLLCGVWVRHSSTAREISSLRSAYAESVEQVRALEDEVTSLRVELDRKKEEIVRLQQEHDRAIREVTADAYRKARTLSDDELLDAYNKLITGARQRNADRERADTSAEE